MKKKKRNEIQDDFSFKIKILVKEKETRVFLMIYNIPTFNNNRNISLTNKSSTLIDKCSKLFHVNMTTSFKLLCNTIKEEQRQLLNGS